MLLSLLFPLLCLVVVAVAYASVGHGGASGYLAILLLFGFAPDELRPLVLLMNVVVTTYLLTRSSKQEWRDHSFLLILVLFSVPSAFVGGAAKIDEGWYRIVLGALLLVSAVRLVVSVRAGEHDLVRPSWYWVAAVGMLLGFISGFTGIGGGVLLSPLLVIFRWTSMRQSIPLVALFILLNSLSGLAGWWAFGNGLVLVEPAFFLSCLLVAFVGACVGSYWSRRKASTKSLRYVLAFVLLLAAGKMIGMAI